MATYKVIQDIEAEDKLLGPLTLRQFIYALVAVLFLYFSFLAFTKHAAFLLVLFLPPALFTGFFAFPFGQDQPTEVWALAKIRFFLKPHRRIWDQSGIKELVTITVPKTIERVYTDNLTKTEVTSRLKALAQTIDTRGWAIKNVNVNLHSQPSAFSDQASDRLIDPSSIPQEVPNYDIQASDDILDEVSNPVAQQFDQMIHTSERTHRQQLIQELNAVRASEAQKATTTLTPPADYWFLNQPVEPPKPSGQDGTVFTKAQMVRPGAQDDSQTNAPQAAEPTEDEEALIKERTQQNRQEQAVSYGHMRTVQPLSASQAGATTNTSGQAQAASPPTPSPAILNLANNNDLNVSTLAREARKTNHPDEPEDEVVISLR
ncbi:MAG TPA: PrgI family protein [Candidatus Saccharimonadales bacterium]|nr:PrgI family protein [Candidatus Saccharimonadales bacterium]